MITSEEVKHRINRDDHIKFILAGNARFTVRNEKTGNRFTFKVNTPKEKRNGHEVHFVSVLTGPENTENYTWLGMIWDLNKYIRSAKSSISEDALSAKVADWFFRNLFSNTLPDFVVVYHEGRCCRCGRVLTVPESIEAGIGPECASRF